MINLSTFLKTYKVGDIVDIKVRFFLRSASISHSCAEPRHI